MLIITYFSFVSQILTGVLMLFLGVLDVFNVFRADVFRRIGRLWHNIDKTICRLRTNIH